MSKNKVESSPSVVGSLVNIYLQKGGSWAPQDPPAIELARNFLWTNHDFIVLN